MQSDRVLRIADTKSERGTGRLDGSLGDAFCLLYRELRYKVEKVVELTGK